jgi:hypothetical protein
VHTGKIVIIMFSLPLIVVTIKGTRKVKNRRRKIRERTAISSISSVHH